MPIVAGYSRAVLPFRASECLVGPTGLLLVGSREEGTRVVRRTRRGFFELALPFEPTRHRPVAWLDDGSFLLVGRNGEAWTVAEDGAITRGTVRGATVLAGVDASYAVAIGPRIFEPRDGEWVGVTPAPQIGDRTKLVLALAGGPKPAVFVDGSFFQRGDRGWVEHSLDDRRVVAATATARGTVYAATTTGALLCITDGETVALALPLGGARVHALAVGAFGLLVGAATGLFTWRAGKTRAIPLPGEGPVTDVSAYTDVEVAVRDGAAYARRLHGRGVGTFGPWQRITIPGAP